MRVLELACAVSAVVVLVSGAGLNEEFTWTRIGYVARPTRKGRETQGDSGYVKKSRNPDAIIFEGNTNEEITGGNEEVLQSGDGIDYRYENNIPMGANVWQDKLFITVPRRRLGVPSTLNYVSLKNPKRRNVPLIPYPSWDINLFPDTSGEDKNLFSVYRVGIDSCDRLWCVDTGVLELPGNITRIKPTTLVIIDLQTDKIIHRYVIPQDQLRPGTTLASITIDVTKESCGDAFAYMPDLSGYGVIAYSLKDDRSWRVSHNFFFLEPLAGEFSIAGHDFQWNDGVFSVELTAINPDGFRYMYFHSMAGTHQYRVSTRILRNETLATRSYHGNDFENVGDRGPLTQTSSADLHKATGIIFLGLVNQNALGCWNIIKPLSTLSIVQKDDKRMIYPSDVKVYNDKVYVLTNTMPEFLYGTLDYDVTNFRVWSNSIEDAVKGTNC